MASLYQNRFGITKCAVNEISPFSADFTVCAAPVCFGRPGSGQGGVLCIFPANRTELMYSSHKFPYSQYGNTLKCTRTEYKCVCKTTI